jgi:hypothetical protein
MFENLVIYLRNKGLFDYQYKNNKKNNKENENETLNNQ